MFKENTQFEILTPSGWKDFKGVVAKGNRDVSNTRLISGRSVKATPDHIFFAAGEQVRVSSLRAGDPIDTTDGGDIVESVTPAGRSDVFDLVEVGDNQHRFCVNNGILSKNCDEFAYVPPNKAKAFWTSIQPTLSTGGACIITSTPKTDEDQFAQIWKGAIDNVDDYGNPRPSGVGRNNFYAIKVTWQEHPERNEAWATTYREQLGEARFQQEMECSFITDDETLINPLTLVRLAGIQPVYYTGTVRWFAEPQPNKTYLVGLDPAYGTGHDDAAIQVFQLPEMVQVAEWQHNSTAPRGQVRVLMQTLIYLDSVLRENPEQIAEPDIYWSVENNTLGEAILTVIEDTGEERFPGNFISEKKRKGQIRRFRKGLLTTNKSKLSASARLKSLVESGRLTINSNNLIRQLKGFVANGGSFGAKPGEHDDLVMSLILVVRMLDVAIGWNSGLSDLREYIDEAELLEGEPMPMTV